MHRFLIVIENAGENFSAYTHRTCRAVSQLAKPEKKPNDGCTRPSSCTSTASWKTSNPFPRPRRSLSTSSFLPELTTRSTTRPARNGCKTLASAHAHDPCLPAG